MFYASVCYEDFNSVSVSLTLEAPNLSTILDCIDTLYDYYHVLSCNIVFAEVSNDL